MTNLRERDRVSLQNVWFQEKKKGYFANVKLTHPRTAQQWLCEASTLHEVAVSPESLHGPKRLIATPDIKTYAKKLP